MCKFGLKMKVMFFVGLSLSSVIPHTLWALTWDIQGVDDCSAYTSLATNLRDYPVIAYGNTLCRLDQERWHFDTIQKDTAQISGFLGTSMALDDNFRPHVFYQVTAADRKLVYAYHDGTQWVRDPADFAYNIVTFYPGLAIDGNGHPHISHPSNNGVFYRHHDGSQWHVTRIYAQGGGNPTELKLDSYERPHVATRVLSLGYKYLTHIWHDGNEWQTLKANLNMTTLGFVSLALDQNDEAVFLACGSGLRFVRKLRANDTSVSWRETVLESVGTFPQGRIVIDPNGIIHIAYINESANQVKYGYFDGAWHLEVVDQVRQIGRDVSLAIDSKNRVHIAYVDTDKGHLRYAQSVSPLYPESRFTVNEDGGMAPLSVQFIDDSTGDISSWLWDFGDGSISTEQNPQHTYVDPGNYDVSLTVAGPHGERTKVRRNCVWTYRLPKNQKYLAYVGKRGTSGFNLEVLDCETRATLLQATVPEMPTSIDVSKNGRYTYLAQKDQGWVTGFSILDPEYGVYVTTRPGYWALTLNNDDSRIYGVTASGENYLVNTGLDDFSNQVTPLFDDEESWSYGPAKAVALTPNGGKLFVATSSYDPPDVDTNYANYVACIQDPGGAAPVVEAVNVGGVVHWGVCVSPDNRNVYVATRSDSSSGGIVVLPVDDLRPFCRREISLVSRPYELAVSPDGKWLYATLGSSRLAVIDTSKESVVRMLSLTTDPRGIAFTPDGKYAYVCSDERVTVVDVAAQTIVDRITIGASGLYEWPFSVAIGPVPTTCGGDLDHDYDVDGTDLAAFARSLEDASSDEFALDFGSVDCEWRLAPDDEMS